MVSTASMSAGRPPEHPDDVLTQTRGPSADPRADAPSGVTHAVRGTQAKALALRRCTLARAGTGKGAPKPDQTFEQETIRVGAHKSNDLVLDGDLAVSRHHAELQFTDRGYLLVDLKSTNGTFVDGRRVERAYLTDGSMLRLGDTKLVFRGASTSLNKSADPGSELGDLVGTSAPMRQVFGALKQVAPLETSVVIQGEPGTGKEHVARTLHERSLRREGPLVRVELESLDEEAQAFELFGPKGGALERAEGGTLVLEEVLALAPALQKRLHDVLESRKLPRAGNARPLALSLRTVCTSREDFARGARRLDFYDPLFQRLAAVTLALPPLRERAEDIHLLAERALEEHAWKLTPEAQVLLETYAWPGNVRELLTVLTHVRPRGGRVTPEDLPERLRGNAAPAPPGFNEHLPFKDAKDEVMDVFERAYLLRVLGRCEGNLARAAKESGLHRKSLERLVRKHRIDVKALKP